MTLAEYKRGAARGSRNALCLTLGTGVGGGIIINGNIYRGRDNATGEIGHLPINEKGPRCNCGGIACLETYIGNNVLLKDAKRLLRRNISLEELSQLAQKGNPAASSLWSQVACRLAVALVGAVNLLNPDCIVIGGGVANAGKALFARVRRHVRKKAMAIQGRRVKIRKAKLGSDAGLIGAAIMVRESLKNKNAA
jgi:glucokinase